MYTMHINDCKSFARGQCVPMDFWDATEGEILKHLREISNLHNMFAGNAVAILQDGLQLDTCAEEYLKYYDYYLTILLCSGGFSPNDHFLL